MKKFLGIIVIAAVATVAGWNFNQSKNEVELSDLTSANIDALARGEAGPDWGHTKLKYNGANACCEDNPYHSCSGIYKPC